jgi:hypothetical protein
MRVYLTHSVAAIAHGATSHRLNLCTYVSISHSVAPATHRASPHQLNPQEGDDSFQVSDLWNGVSAPMSPAPDVTHPDPTQCTHTRCHPDPTQCHTHVRVTPSSCDTISLPDLLISLSLPFSPSHSTVPPRLLQCTTIPSCCPLAVAVARVSVTRAHFDTRTRSTH